LIQDIQAISGNGNPEAAVIDIANPSRAVVDGAITSGSTTLTSATAKFTWGDVGATVTGTGIPAFTSISSVTNLTTVVLSANATATSTGVSVSIADLSAYGIVASTVYSGGIATGLVNDHNTNGGIVSGVSSKYVLGLYVRDSKDCVWTTSADVAANCASMVTAGGTNTFTGVTTFSNKVHHQDVHYADPTGTAVGAGNFASNFYEPCVSYGSSVLNCTGKFYIQPGSGSTPSIFWKMDGMTGAGTNFIDFGSTTTPITPDFYVNARFFNSAGTFSANVSFAGTASRTITFPDIAGTIEVALSGTSASWNNGGASIAANTCVLGPTANVTSSTTSMALAVSPAATPGLGLTWANAYISSGTTAQVVICNITAGAITPSATTYNIRAIQ
jgi:hypothetical protein